jgi:lysozyme
MDQQKADDRLKADEGTGPIKGGRFVVYDDATGKPIVPGSHVIGHPTIGYGRALDVNGLTPIEALDLLHNSEDETEAELDKALPWWRNLDDVRQVVMLSLAYNMGIGDATAGTGLLGFHTTLTRWQAGDYVSAAAGLRASKWFTQVGKRGPLLANMLETGQWGTT